MSTDFRCRACGGYGVIARDSDHPCPSCGGSGFREATPAGATESSQPSDRPPDVTASEATGAGRLLLTEEDATRAVSAYFSMHLPGHAAIATFVWRCDHGDRSRCSPAAVWHVRVNDQVCAVYESGHVKPAFANLLSLEDIRRPSYEELAALNAELGSKSREAVTRLLDLIERYARWDVQSGRFVCTDSGWVTTVQALDYYVDDPELWQKRAEAASKAAIDDEMEEWERGLQNAARERLTARFNAATSGARTVPKTL